MPTPYHAQVQSDGLVTEVRKASAERVASLPEEYPGTWIAVPDMRQYPAPGWTWSAEHGFRPPEPKEHEGWDADARRWIEPEAEE